MSGRTWYKSIKGELDHYEEENLAGGSEFKLETLTPDILSVLMQDDEIDPFLMNVENRNPSELEGDFRKTNSELIDDLGPWKTETGIEEFSEVIGAAVPYKLSLAMEIPINKTFVLNSENSLTEASSTSAPMTSRSAEKEVATLVTTRRCRGKQPCPKKRAIVPRRGKGRPRGEGPKNPTDPVMEVGIGSESEAEGKQNKIGKRGRGRPQKYKTPDQLESPFDQNGIPKAIPFEHLTVKPKQKKANKKATPENKKTDKYYEMRRSNTEAAARCRAGMRENDMRIKQRLGYLENMYIEHKETIETQYNELITLRINYKKSQELNLILTNENELLRKIIQDNLGLAWIPV